MAQPKNDEVASEQDHTDILAGMFATLLPLNAPERYRKSQSAKYRIERPAIFGLENDSNSDTPSKATIMDIALPLNAAPRDIIPLIDKQLGAHVTYALLNECCAALAELCEGPEGEELMAVFMAAATSEEEHQNLINAIQRNNVLDDLPNALKHLQTVYFQIEE